MSHVLVGFKSNLDWNLKLHVTPTWHIPYCKQIFIYSHATFLSLCYLQRCTFYNSTALSPKEQVHNAIIIEHFKPPLASMPYARILVCSTFLPFCVSSHRQVQPCRHLASRKNHPVFTFFAQAI